MKAPEEHYKVEINHSSKNFFQVQLIRSRVNGRDYDYSIWRRIDHKLETWLCVMWHSNWQGSTRASWISCDRNEVEQWTLRRLHQASICIDETVIEDFKRLAQYECPQELKTAKEEMQNLYQNLCLDDIYGIGEDADVYLSDAMYLTSSGDIIEK